MSNLITLNEIRRFWPVSLNIDDNRVDPYILRAEQANLQSILTPPLFLALKSGWVRPFADPEFVEGFGQWSHIANGSAPTGAFQFLQGEMRVPVLNPFTFSWTLYQKLFVPATTFRIVFNCVVTTNCRMYALGSRNGISWELIGDVQILNGDIELNITTTTPYLYLGVRVYNTDGALTTEVRLSKVQSLSEERWNRLMIGERYRFDSNFDQLFPGVAQLLCAYSYAYLVDNNQIHVTRGGVNKKNTEQSENAIDRTVSIKSQEAYSEAIRLEGEFFKWISVANPRYLEYSGGIPNKNTSLNFFNASRRVVYGFEDNWCGNKYKG